MITDEDKKIWEKLDQPHRDMLLSRKRWRETARPKQLTPDGDWFVWLLMGGRGAGKTRTGAEDMAWYAAQNPGSRLAVVAPTINDARKTCFEGESGLLKVIPASFIKAWNRSLGELILTNGSMFNWYTAEEPERLRGANHHRAWCDELGAWKYPQDTWDNMVFGLRLGVKPQIVVTTTPRSTPLIKTLVKDKNTLITRETTFANAANLAASALRAFKERYEGTRLGRQELSAELLDDAPGALFSREKIDMYRVNRPEDLPELTRVVVAVDPAVAAPENDAEGLAETGIVVVGLGVDGWGYVLDDLSGRYLPNDWARKAIAGLDLHDGDVIVAEINQGGAMVKSTIRTVASQMNRIVRVVEVHASKGKVTRAEPVSALYEQGRVRHVGSALGKLEDQMVLFTSTGIDGDTTGDRVDALVWALTELFPKIVRKVESKGVNPVIENSRSYRPHSFGR